MAYNNSMAGIGDAGKPEVETSAAMRKALAVLKYAERYNTMMIFCIYIIGIMTGIIFCLDSLMRLAFRTLDDGFQLDWLTWLLLLAPIAGITGVVLLVRHILLKAQRYKLGIRRRIEQADLLERIAQGPGGLPDIYEYTAFPWRLLLGAKPKTLARSLQVIAFNIDWYLLPAPKAYIKPEWMVGVVLLVAYIPIIAGILCNLMLSKGTTYSSPAGTILLTGTGYYLQLILQVILLYSLYQHYCKFLTYQILAGIIRDRYGLQ